jgi:hypothetical protein
MKLFLQKKMVFAALLALLSGSAFAIDFSTSGGLGINFISDFSSGTANVKNGIPSVVGDLGYSNDVTTLGAHVFFDVTYLEVSLGIYAYSAELTLKDSVGGIFYPSTTKYSGSYMDIGLLAKFPIAIGDRFSLGPALGFEYRNFLSADNYADIVPNGKAADLNSALINLGAVADLSFNAIYLRWGIFVNYKFQGNPEDAVWSTLKDSFWEDPFFLSMGVKFKFAVGYKFTGA